jgi:hypothetical protein
MSYIYYKSNDCNDNLYPKCNTGYNTGCNSHLKNIYNQCINPSSQNVINCPNNPPNVSKLADRYGKAIYVYNNIFDYELKTTSDLTYFYDLNNVCNYGMINTFRLGDPTITAGNTFNINFNNINYYKGNIGDWFELKNLTQTGFIMYVNFNTNNILHNTTDPQVDQVNYLEYRRYTIYKIEKDVATNYQKNYWMTF